MSRPSVDTEAFNDQTPLYNSSIVANYIHYLTSRHGAVDIDDLLRASGLSRYDINDRGYFLSQQQLNGFHRCLDERLNDPQIAFKVGQHILLAKSAGVIKQYGLQFLSPANLYKAVDRLYPKLSRGHLTQTVITGKDRAELTVRVRTGVQEEPFQCENRLGIFQAMGALLTGQPSQVAHPRCMHRGDDSCHYEITWRDKPAMRWKRLAMAAAGLTLLATAASLPGAEALHGQLILLATGGVLSLALLLQACRLENKELTRFLKEQGDAAAQLFRENEARYQESLLVQNIGRAGADALGVRRFLETVLESMSQNLDFSRGVILLCDEKRQLLRQVAHYGFRPQDLAYLDRLNFQIDIDNRADLFINALTSGRPVFLNSIHEHAGRMDADSIAAIELLEVKALIGAPLIYKHQPLGFLFVDSQAPRRETTTSDVNLLMGIAAQVATGIVNAQSYERLQESEQRYRLLAENVADVIWILDAQSLSMKYVSPSVVKSQGYTPDELMAMTINQYLTPDSFQAAAAALDEALQHLASGTVDPAEFSTTLELEVRHKNGSLIPVEVTAGFFADGQKTPNTFLGITRDLSERKRAERERSRIETKLQQAHKMESLGTMAGSIAHNFNNLLMVVLGNLELAKEELADDSMTGVNVQRAIHASQRAADLSNMMLTYVGQLKKESLPVDLSQLVTSELERLDESELDHVTLDLALEDPMPLVAADPTQISQVVSGLVTNAIESLGKQTGQVRIATGTRQCDSAFLATTYLKEDLCEGTYAYLEVSDTGCGMDEETLGRVFDPFFSTKFTGRGLGLAAVMGIIRSHSGAVQVQSKKGKGSRFVVLFPIQGISLARPALADSLEASPQTQNKTVLIVDDEAMVLEIGGRFLQRLGYQVQTAASGHQAIELVRKLGDRIDCLLLDFTMPGMDGRETMLQVKQIQPSAKVIITSGYTRQQIETRFARRDPPDAFIHKPFELKSLERTLQEILSR